jgi:shikimate dehydrogenase
LSGPGPDRRISGGTRLAAVIGHPVRHSLSPLLHNAAFEALHLDWRYLALEVAPGDAAAAVAGMRVLGIGGLNVTMPHKAAVAAAVDRLSVEAATLQAVNTVAWDGAELVGHNTDGAGFLASLRDRGVDPAGRRCLVVGAGGAARAVVLALAGAGAAEIVVASRRPEAAAPVVALAPRVVRPGSADEADAAGLVVNATPVGMGGGVGANDSIRPVEPSRLGPGQVVVDLVYEPVQTGLLVDAGARGALAVDGTGMLLHQAAAAFRLWTGVEAPIEAMSAALAAALEARRRAGQGG